MPSNNPNAQATLTPFTKDNQPEGRGRPKGSRNRTTIAKMILAMPADKVLNKDQLDKIRSLIPGADLMTVEEIITIAQITKAIDSRSSIAYKNVLDSAYGMPKQELTGPNDAPLMTDDLTNLTIDEIRERMAAVRDAVAEARTAIDSGPEDQTNG